MFRQLESSRVFEAASVPDRGFQSVERGITQRGIIHLATGRDGKIREAIDIVRASLDPYAGFVHNVAGIKGLILVETQNELAMISASKAVQAYHGITSLLHSGGLKFDQCPFPITPVVEDDGFYPLDEKGKPLPWPGPYIAEAFIAGFSDSTPEEVRTEVGCKRILEYVGTGRPVLIRSVLALSPDGIHAVTFEGRMIAHTADKVLMGDYGFGFDPIVIPDGYPSDISLATITPQQKNSFSMRSLAYEAVLQFLNRINKSRISLAVNA